MTFIDLIAHIQPDHHRRGRSSSLWEILRSSFKILLRTKKRKKKKGSFNKMTHTQAERHAHWRAVVYSHTVKSNSLPFSNNMLNWQENTRRDKQDTRNIKLVRQPVKTVEVGTHQQHMMQILCSLAMRHTRIASLKNWAFAKVRASGSGLLHRRGQPSFCLTTSECALSLTVHHVCCQEAVFCNGREIVKIEWVSACLGK